MRYSSKEAFFPFANGSAGLRRCQRVICRIELSPPCFHVFAEYFGETHQKRKKKCIYTPPLPHPRRICIQEGWQADTATAFKATLKSFALFEAFAQIGSSELCPPAPSGAGWRWGATQSPQEQFPCSGPESTCECGSK